MPIESTKAFAEELHDLMDKYGSRITPMEMLGVLAFKSMEYQRWVEGAVTDDEDDDGEGWKNA